jgi:hypothetical protein
MKTTNFANLKPAQQAKRLNAITRTKSPKPSNKTGIKTYIEVSKLPNRLLNLDDKIGIYLSENYDFAKRPLCNVDRFTDFVITRSKVVIQNHIAYFEIKFPNFDECVEIGFLENEQKDFYEELRENNFFLFGKSKLREIYE